MFTTPMAFPLVLAVSLQPAPHAAPVPASPGEGPVEPAPPGYEDRFQAMQQELDALLKKSRQQDERIRQLEAETGERWLTEQRAEQVRGIVRDVLSDSEQRASFRKDGATSGFDRNFFIASPDGNYRLNIEGQIQSRWSFNFMPTPGLTAGPVTPGGKQNEYGFELRRVRLNFFGNVVDPSWTYRVQIAFERDGTIQNRPLTLEDAFLQKALGGGWFFRMGQWKNFFNYEEINSSRTQQLIERSMLNQYFTTQFIQGALLGWESQHVRTYLSYNDGGGNRNIAVIQKNGNPTDWAFTGRVDWLLTGEWGQMRDMQGWVGSPFAAMAGLAVNAQRASGVVTENRLTVGNGAIPGLDGLVATVAPLNLTSWTADINLRGSGWSGWAAFLGNYMSSSDAGAAARGVGSVLSLGAVVQGGIFITDSVELFARYEGLWVSSGNDGMVGGKFVANALVAQTMNAATVGISWYFAKNAAKFALDGGVAFNPVKFDRGLYGESITGADWRASETGEGAGEVVVRAQMQVLF
ncbi:MAG: hypothetical protein FGM39_01190 [Phycisphaerales bacterium]|nr:hypothetical protein [Phycisphaerales bacterium]